MIRLLLVLLASGMLPIFAAAQGGVSGSLESNTNFYQRDSAIGATGTPHYDNRLSGTDAWLSLNYNNNDWGFAGGVRLDLFNNSNLHDPTVAYSEVGIGRVWITKEINDLTLTAGHFYDQFGSGITFRAYEARALGIDNAIFGIRAKYDINDNWNIRGFTGVMKDRFGFYDPIIKGAALEGYHDIKTGKASIAPGVAIVNRTMDQGSMDLIVNGVNAKPENQRFIPAYNAYAYSFYNTTRLGRFSWYLELAGKTPDPIVNLSGELVEEPGSVYYSSLTYSHSSGKGKGIGITGQFKRTENFAFRTSSNETLLDGVINFLPSTARQNTYRLLARYNPATQDLSEQAYQIDVIYSANKNLSFSANHSGISNLSGDQLWQEFYADVTWKKKLKDKKKVKLTAGGQYIIYNQLLYEGKGASGLNGITPFLEVTYNFDRKKSLRTEFQYLNSSDDYGSWLFFLAEFVIAPKWAFAISDMYNVAPLLTDDLHYPTLFLAYTAGANRFSLSYVKQVEGIVCTGGVCRYEPAFSGFKLGVNSNF